MSTTWINRGHLYAPHVTPVLVDCNFQVNAADAAGLGIVAGSLKGQGVANVFMHTTATPGKGPNGQLNPNPPAGYIYVQLADNFYSMFHTDFITRGPLSGSNLAVNATALTVGSVYTITTVGTSTNADWLALGVPAGVIPAIGVSFIAKLTGSGSGSGQVQVEGTSGIDGLEFSGDPSTTLSAIPVGGSPNVGGWILLKSELSGTVTAAAAGSRIYLKFYMSQSSVKVLGE
jgi:hypothetical protein